MFFYCSSTTSSRANAVAIYQWRWWTIWVLKQRSNTMAKRTSVHEFAVSSPTHGDKDGLVYLNKYHGRVLLIVNVASCWTLSPSQYKGLTELHAKYHEQGLSILAFPCNQFAKQEPGTEEEIQKFAKSLGVRFPIFDKIEVNGKNVEALFGFLK